MRLVLTAKLAPAGAARLRVLGGVGVVTVAGALFAPVRLAVVTGDSMAPRLKPGQVLLCERNLKEPVTRGEIVLAQVGGMVCVKRVFAVGGDRFWEASFGPKDNAQPQLIEPSASIAAWRRRYPNLRFREIVVPPASVFLLGEANVSQDSRTWGPVTERRVLGRVLLPATQQDAAWLHSVAWTHPPQRPPLPSRS